MIKRKIATISVDEDLFIFVQNSSNDKIKHLYIDMVTEVISDDLRKKLREELFWKK